MISTTTTLARRVAAFGAAGLFAAIATVGGAGSAFAEGSAPIDGPAHHTNIVEWGEQVWSGSTGDTAALITLVADADKRQIVTYCIEDSVFVRGDVAYGLRDWNGYTASTPGWGPNKGRILWILLHSTPTLPAADVLTAAGAPATAAGMGTDRQDVITGTQAAIWTLTDGFDIDRTKANARVLAVHDYLLHAAQDLGPSGPKALVRLDGAATGAAGSVVGPLTLDATSDATVQATLADGSPLPAGYELLTSPDPATKAVDGATYASGSTFYLSVPADAEAGSVTLTASGTMRVPVGYVWDGDDATTQTQALITAQETTAHASSTGTLSWTARPAEPATPATPSTSTTEPAAPTTEPTQPAAEPTTPAQPSTPAQPAAEPSTAPVEPATTAPATPVSPAAPVAPAAPVVPAQPATSAPSAPAATIPATPAPVAPSAPVVPAAPAAPVVPAAPTSAPATSRPATSPSAPAAATPVNRASTTPAASRPAPRPVVSPRGPVAGSVRTAPARPRGPIAAGTPGTVTRTFQVDRYIPRTAAQAAVVSRLDDDGRLGYREDVALWGASRWQMVTVTVPANATTAQVVAAINAKTNAAVGDVATTAPLRALTAGGSVTVAWELGRGATPSLAWGPRHDVTQRFVARS